MSQALLLISIIRKYHLPWFIWRLQTINFIWDICQTLIRELSTVFFFFWERAWSVCWEMILFTPTKEKLFILHVDEGRKAHTSSERFKNFYVLFSFPFASIGNQEKSIIFYLGKGGGWIRDHCSSTCLHKKKVMRET